MPLTCDFLDSTSHYPKTVAHSAVKGDSGLGSHVASDHHGILNENIGGAPDLVLAFLERLTIGTDGLPCDSRKLRFPQNSYDLGPRPLVAARTCL